MKKEEGNYVRNFRNYYDCQFWAFMAHERDEVLPIKNYQGQELILSLPDFLRVHSRHLFKVYQCCLYGSLCAKVVCAVLLLLESADGWFGFVLVLAQL